MGLWKSGTGRILSLAVMAAALALRLPAAQPGGRLVRVTAGDWEVFTDAGEAAARRAMLVLLEASGAWRPEGFLPVRPSLPVRVLLFRTQDEFARIRPGPVVKGFYQSSPERDFIALAAGEPSARRILLHELTHLRLQHVSVTLPAWLEEGLAEFHSTLERGKNAVVLGRPVPEHLALLRSTRWMDAAQLWNVSRESSYFHDPAGAGLFYAQSWAVAHLLVTGAGYRGKLPRYLGMLFEGADPAEAFPQAFGVSFESLVKEARERTLSRQLPVFRLPLSGAALQLQVRVEPLAETDWRLALWELANYSGKLEAGQTFLDQLANRPSHSPEIHTVLGLAAVRNRDLKAAAEHFQSAIQNGSASAVPYFEYAMLLREQRAGREKIIPLLEEAIRRNPGYAEAHFILGLMEAAAGDNARAIEHYRAAADLLPRQSSFWHALAMAHYDEGNLQDAHRAARVALHTATGEPERRRAEAALTLIRKAMELPPGS